MTPMENPSKRDVGVNGVVTMETRRKAEERKEEERWRKLYPEIKKCVIVIARQSLDRLNVLKLKQEKNGERREEEGGGRWRSGDPEQRPDWMEPVEQDESGGGGEVRFTRFVKKVEVKVWPNHAPANGARGPRGRSWGSGLLRLRQSPDVTTDPADPAHRPRRLQSEGVMERWRRITQSHEEINDNINQSETDHNHSLNAIETDTPGTPNSQSQDAR